MRTRRTLSRGFTLLETALATIIVGTGFVSTLALFAACTQQTQDAERRTAAMMLAMNVQEAMATASFQDAADAAHFGPEPGETLAGFDDLDDFDGLATRPPIDALRQPIAELGRYEQIVRVLSVDPDRPTTESAGEPCRRVEVTVRYHADGGPVDVYSLVWLRMR
jgi:type II secretory pathway pseudopilin PulG